LLLLLGLLAVCVLVDARVLLSARNHRFKEGENVPLFANKVGPFHNPRYAIVVLLLCRFRDLDVEFGTI